MSLSDDIRSRMTTIQSATALPWRKDATYEQLQVMLAVDGVLSRTPAAIDDLETLRAAVLEDRAAHAEFMACVSGHHGPDDCDQTRLDKATARVRVSSDALLALVPSPPEESSPCP